LCLFAFRQKQGELRFESDLLDMNFDLSKVRVFSSCTVCLCLNSDRSDRVHGCKWFSSKQRQNHFKLTFMNLFANALIVMDSMLCRLT